MRRALMILMGIMAAASAWASSITVSGEVSGNWAVDTVFVAGEVRVPPDSALTIQPGVKVLFLAQVKFIVDNGATLRAIGTATDSITFDGFPTGSLWRGIRFLAASDSSRLEYCRLRHGLASGVGDDNRGAAIYLNSSSPLITHCLISENHAMDSGGGLYLTGVSHPLITHNAIADNNANGNGGGVNIYIGSDPEIAYNYISANHAGSEAYGGGLYLTGSADLHDNLIMGNFATFGGGLAGSGATNVILRSNRIDNNSAMVGGGLNCINFAFASFDLNEVCYNTATTQAGALFFNNTSPVADKNTFAFNSSGFVGGLYLFNYSRLNLSNSIIWSNSQQNVYLAGNSNATITYSDVQGGWTGSGNFSADPQFVNAVQVDCRLMWGSPAIDSGNPNPGYNDPDNTRADLGAWYCNQSLPVRLLLTPYYPPIQIPAAGGDFTYQILANNVTASPHQVWVTARVILPTGILYGPIWGPIALTLTPGYTLTRVRLQSVPAAAPAGQYLYLASAITGADSSGDSFSFTKAGNRSGSPAAGEWLSRGDDLTAEAQSILSTAEPGTAPSIAVSPNPFNPTTAISYQLQATSQVRLTVWDTAGRLVATLVDGQQEAGSHSVTFNGSKLPSGLYLYKLAIAGKLVSGKMLLIK